MEQSGGHRGGEELLDPGFLLNIESTRLITNAMKWYEEKVGRRFGLRRWEDGQSCCKLNWRERKEVRKHGKKHLSSQ